jgi:hypothetical protein
MSTYTSEPGTRLAGRYRLADQISGGSGWTQWKAIDETLARPVTVLTFAPGFPRIGEVVTAARAASRLTDPRLTQVFDVEDNGESAYVVMEWLTGQPLTDLLGEGPLESGRAVSLVLESAQALSAAHAAGQAHLRLNPQSLRWTRSGGVKISGLGIDAALSGPAMTATPADEPAVADTKGLARLLYAALTGCWPGDDPSSLPPAPADDGRTLTARQVSADVPAAVDDVLCRALWQRPGKHGPAITSAADFADNLAAVAPPLPLPEPAPAPQPRMPSGGFPRSEDTSQWSLPPAGATGSYRGRRPARQTDPATKAVLSVVIVLVLVAVGATAWMLSSALQHGHASANSGSAIHHSTAPSAAAAVQLTPASVQTYDPKEPGGDDASGASAVLSGGQDPWHTSYYLDQPTFGNLKPGTGLIFDMGKDVSLSSISIQFGNSCCNTFHVAIGNDPSQDQTGFSSLKVIGSSAQGSGTTKLTLNSHATGRYVLIWLTSLAPYAQGPSNSYEAQIYHVTMQGSAARSSG